MDTKDWITIGVAISTTTVTVINGWLQFWVKERLFNKDNNTTDRILTAFKTKSGISFIAFTGVLSTSSIGLVVLEVLSNAPLTRLSCFKISGLTALSIINVFLIGSIYTLRKTAILKEQLEESEKRLKAGIDGKASKAYVMFMS